MIPRNRHTAQRALVLMAVKTHGRPLSARDVQRLVRRTMPTIGFATVYRNLELLARRGELYAVEGDRGVRRYVGYSRHESIFRCLRCGTEVVSVRASMRADVQRIVGGIGTVHAVRIVTYGICRNCASEKTTA